MATSANMKRLQARGVIHPVKVELELGERAERQLYISTQCRDWLRSDLKTLETSVFSDATPLEQADALFYRFISGKRLHYDHEIGDLRPLELGIWELKSPDLRFFGWFPIFDLFLAAFCNDATKVKRHDLYRGHINECVRLRAELLVCPPPFIQGGLRYVISN